MKTTSMLCVCLALAMVAAVPASLVAEEGGWKMPNLNPFARKSALPTSSRVSDGPSSSWKMPRLWPTSTARKSKPKGPSTWQRMSKGTSDFFSKTSDALNPWDDEEVAEPRALSGSRGVVRRASAPKEEKSNSFFPAWMGAYPEEETSKSGGSVNDFLSQPRPGY